MQTWYTEGNEYYAQQLELSLSRALSAHLNPTFFPYRGNGNELLQDKKDTDGTAPPHFYGELSKTQEGCALLLKSVRLETKLFFLLLPYLFSPIFYCYVLGSSHRLYQGHTGIQPAQGPP
jgi:hypothetical protein